MIESMALGIVSDSCPECETLKNRLQAEFQKHKIDLSFVELSYDDDPKGAMDAASEFGLNEVPSFLVGEVVFSSFFGNDQVVLAVANIKKQNA